MRQSFGCVSRIGSSLCHTTHSDEAESSGTVELYANNFCVPRFLVFNRLCTVWNIIWMSFISFHITWLSLYLLHTTNLSCFKGPHRDFSRHRNTSVILCGLIFLCNTHRGHRPNFAYCDMWICQWSSPAWSSFINRSLRLTSLISLIWLLALRKPFVQTTLLPQRLGHLEPSAPLKSSGQYPLIPSIWQILSRLWLNPILLILLNTRNRAVN